MSFSSDLKAELGGIIPKARHCQISELTAVLEILGRPYYNPGDSRSGIRIRTESRDLIQKLFTILDKAFKIGNECAGEAGIHSENKKDCEVLLTDPVLLRRVAKASAENEATERTCCQRSYLRGAYLAAGTISDPNRYYHLEIVCPDDLAADKVLRLMRHFDLNAKAVDRKGLKVVYLKEAEQIAEMLRLTGANRMLMEFENIRIMREMRGSVNRQVNCETANLRKTADAAVKQAEDIRFLKERGIFNTLPPALRRAAEARLDYPEASFAELGRYMTPPVGKSGVNHRLRRIGEIAAEVRAKES